MTTIIDYLNWRGDLSFAVTPLNEVDMAIFAELSYFDFSEIFHLEEFTDTQEVPLQYALEYLWIKYGFYEERITDPDHFLKNPLGHNGKEFLTSLRNSTRYNESKLSYFVNTIDIEKQEQFSAVLLKNIADYQIVVFRGTDNSLIGWKENFNMTFSDSIPAQIEAMHYVNRIANKVSGKLILCGHSKGGNLAMYAAMKAEDKVFSRIDSIYNFDGPGLHKNLVESPAFQRVVPLIHLFVPEDTIIGMLLENSAPYQIVKSTAKYIEQHSLFTWIAQATKFQEAEKRTDWSLYYDRTLSDWLYSVTPQQRELFIDSCYDSICSLEFSKFSEVLEKWRPNAWDLFKSFHTKDKGTRKEIRMVLRMLIHAGVKNIDANFSFPEEKVQAFRDFWTTTKEKKDGAMRDVLEYFGSQSSE